MTTGEQTLAMGEEFSGKTGSVMPSFFWILCSCTDLLQSGSRLYFEAESLRYGRDHGKLGRMVHEEF